MNSPSATKLEANGAGGPSRGGATDFGCPRDWLDNRFVYTVISPRARGLSVGVNMNPDNRGNLDCVYCEGNRAEPAHESRLDVPVMMTELERTLALVHSGEIGQRPCYRRTPPELLELRQVALSGDGEPTLCPNFAEAVEAVIHLRARGRFPRFKIVLLTNASGLGRAEVAEGLSLFTPQDEVWAKLEAGTQDYLNRVHRSGCALAEILANILLVARLRPVVIQSLFVSIEGEAPPAFEIEACVQRLRELKEAGAQIQLVQVYSATGPALSLSKGPAHPECGHLPLQTLSHIARRVREVTGLKAEVF